MGRRPKAPLTDDEDTLPSYSLVEDNNSAWSFCCICYRYLLDICLVLALSPFVVNCGIEAIIYLINFDYADLTWGRALLGLFVVSLWLTLVVFGVLCCIAIIKKGVFTRRLRQKQRNQSLP